MDGKLILCICQGQYPGRGKLEHGYTVQHSGDDMQEGFWGRSCYLWLPKGLLCGKCGGKGHHPRTNVRKCLSSPMTWSCFKVTLRGWPLSGLRPPWEALTVSMLCSLGGGSVAQWLWIWALESVVLNDPGKLFNPCYPSSCSSKWE